MITKKCKICGKEFQTMNDKGTYCSNACKSKAFRLRRKKIRRNLEKEEKDELIINQKHEIDLLNYVINNKNEKINEFQTALNNNYAEYQINISNMKFENNLLEIKINHLKKRNEELEGEIEKYKVRIKELKKQ